MQPTKTPWLARLLPFTNWLFHYDRKNFVGDLTAGIVVAIMLVPQGMAYAMLAGLPPEVGLYASILPLVIYGLFASSRVTATGPVAMVSLMVATGIGGFAVSGSPEYIGLALTLALMVGVIQLVMGALRLGFMVNFLSHPVVSGFTSAAALIIGFSQFKHIMAVNVGRADYPFQTIASLATEVPNSHLLTVAMGIGSIVILVYFKKYLASHLKALRVREKIALPVSKAAPLVVVLLGTVGVYMAGWSDVKSVGDIPAGLPAITLPAMELSVLTLLTPIALTIVFVSYMESVSVSKSLAAKRRQSIDANQELIALGGANLGAAFTGGYPVTGGFSRSVVNYSAGANTGLASLITAGLVALTVMFLTPLFYYLPKVVLATIIVVAVSTLVDFKTARHTLKFSKADGAALLVTFIGVLGLGIEVGLVIGIGVSLVMHLARTSRPHVAVVGRIGESEHFRNIQRHPVLTYPNLLLVRVDESLYFANTRFLEDKLQALVSDNPDASHVVLIFSAVNNIDASALESLENTVNKLRDAGVTMHLAEVKGPVHDRLQRIGFNQELAPGRIFMSTHQAVAALSPTTQDPAKAA
ncbi:MAG: SulP family inorganic anion transporter [Planctomycetota bacterium]|jgi:SulP family sulfate permease